MLDNLYGGMSLSMDLKATEQDLQNLFEAFNSNCICDLWWKLIPDL